MDKGREQNGRFAVGNPGGPGRPRRAVENDYLATMSEIVGLDTWKRIVEKAVSKAEHGDAKSREWLSRYLLGNEPGSLLEIAATEFRGLDRESEIRQEAEKQVELEALATKFRLTSQQ